MDTCYVLEEIILNDVTSLLCVYMNRDTAEKERDRLSNKRSENDMSYIQFRVRPVKLII